MAKDSKRGVHLKGGLGALGVGEMWFKTTDQDRDKEEYKQAPEFDTGDKKLFGIYD